MTDHVDVLIVGAGLSGIGAACRLKQALPAKTFAILESRDSIGGTWDLFTYPGVRSDSDMHTLGYPFRPWTGATGIADGAGILEYIRDTAREFELYGSIRFRHRAIRASWDSGSALWTVMVRRTDTGEESTLTCGFLYLCTGYFDYDHGHTPDFEGRDNFTGAVVHPQQWPDGLDVSDRRVAIIGSGATAVTLVPALAARGARVTMIQRTPTYIVSLPTSDRLADALRRRLPSDAALSAIRRRNIAFASLSYGLSRRSPRLMKNLIRRGLRRELPDGYDIETHFTPPYDPWDQRLCVAPGGDFFAAIRSGRADVVTGRISRFTATGVEMESGDVVEADIVVTATGLDVLVLGGIGLEVDGIPRAPRETVGYKGMMLSGIPNMAVALGYTNASWTLKCDLTARYLCRLIAHMDVRGYRVAMPLPPGDDVAIGAFLDLTSGYVVRAAEDLPRQGSRAPWRLNQNYRKDVKLMVHGPLEDEGIRFS